MCLEVKKMIEELREKIIICCCNDVMKEEIEVFIDWGIIDIEEIKRFLRIGMGFC